MEIKVELKKSLEKGSLYDFIANHGHKFEKSDLIDIIKNLDYAIFSELGAEVCDEIEKKTIETLEEINFFEE